MHMLRLLVCAVTIFSLIGCTTLQVIPPTQNIASALEAGDSARVYTNDGRVFDLRVKAFDRDSFVGADSAGEHRIPWTQISRIEKREVSGFKTTGAVFLGILATVAALLTVAVIAYTR